MPQTDCVHVYVHCDLGNMTLTKGQDTPLGHGQLFEVKYQDPTRQ